MRKTSQKTFENARARRAVRDAPAFARALRVEAGLTQVEVAAALGVTNVAVSRWERGLRVPRGEVADRYLGFLRRACEATAGGAGGA